MNKKQKQSIINLIIAVIFGLILSYILGFIASGFQFNPENWLIRTEGDYSNKVFYQVVFTLCSVLMMLIVFLNLNDNNDSK